MQTTNAPATRDRFVVTLPPDLIERVKQLSVVERRSVSHQTELLLERALQNDEEDQAA